MLFEKISDLLINNKYNIDIKKDFNTLIGDFFMIYVNRKKIKIAFNVCSNPIFVAKLCFLLSKIYDNFEISSNFYIQNSEIFIANEALDKYREDLEKVVKSKIENDKLCDILMYDNDIEHYNA